MEKILLLTGDDADYRARLSGCEISEDPTQASIWLAEPARAATLLRQGHRPAWLASTFAGVDPLMASDLPRDYRLTNVRGIFGPLMAEYVFAHLLSRLRHLPRYAAQQDAGQWAPHPYATLAGQTLVLLGTGSIAQSIARVANAFGMTVLGVSRSGDAKAGFERVHPVAELTAALGQADVLVSVLPNTPQSRGLLDAHALAALPAHALLINVGRGHTLDHPALLAQLDAGALGHAVLDVFEQEPLPPASPLWSHPGITLTPHIAATSFAEQIAQQFLDNLARYRRGEPLAHQVDFTRGY
ncbi:D-2-hydroxyacid dehydrogenase [Ferrimonas balearica]|uniref:D-2-hydroxyacid dehydrogenase n=1 Tax=Ferrimonas balearica TaxID=44012 RepID=UPI001C993B51|nr:D-2-hydroxyacid dehydrogenase [Ferrimonas balearica]MBY5992282.1 D-2-hydroxyacid dehydrogenase [Ferrimonas balearica]